MSVKKLAYYLSIIMPIWDFICLFVDDVRKFADNRKYLNELADFNASLDINYKGKGVK